MGPLFRSFLAVLCLALYTINVESFPNRSSIVNLATQISARNFEKFSEFPKVLNWSQLVEFLNLNNETVEMVETKNSTSEHRIRETHEDIKANNSDFNKHIGDKKQKQNKGEIKSLDDFSIYIIGTVFIVIKEML